jgi:hypothetical protein
MTTLKITFYKNIRSALVLVNHHFLILGGKSVCVCVCVCGRGDLMSGQFSQQIIIFFDKDIIDDDYEDECYDFQDELFYF